MKNWSVLGKPARIMLCTHWHDGRTVYNESVRKLADYWDIPLIEFDANIGFSKDDEENADPGAPSRKMAMDVETIDGVRYGWHPLWGKDREVQQRMAEIFIRALEEHYGELFVVEQTLN